MDIPQRDLRCRWSSRGHIWRPTRWHLALAPTERDRVKSRGRNTGRDGRWRRFDGRPKRLLAGMLLFLLSGTPSWARSPLTVEVRVFSTRYHEHLSRLDAIREELLLATKNDADVEDLIALAQVCFIWGDVRAATSEQKLAAYEQGRRAAKRAVELDPKNAAAHFWYGTNTARWGQSNGVVRSLFLLPTVRQEIQTVLALDPKFTPVYALAGNVLYEVPTLAGGDLRRAEEMFRTGLKQDPKFTGMRVGLAKVLIRQHRVAEARRELQTVLDERDPRNLADWVMKDSAQALTLLRSIQ